MGGSCAHFLPFFALWCPALDFVPPSGAALATVCPVCYTGRRDIDLAPLWETEYGEAKKAEICSLVLDRAVCIGAGRAGTAAPWGGELAGADGTAGTRRRHNSLCNGGPGAGDLRCPGNGAGADRLRQRAAPFRDHHGACRRSDPAKGRCCGTGATLPKPTRKGYTFVGWYTDSKCTKKVSRLQPWYSGKKTLYAKWKK